MIDLKQRIKVKWNNFTKSWYENKGYNFTKNNDEFEVKAEDLKLNSTAIVNIHCK